MELYNSAINADPNHGASWLAKAQVNSRRGGSRKGRRRREEEMQPD